MSIVNTKSSVFIVCISFISIEINLDYKWDIRGIDNGISSRIGITIQSSSTISTKIWYSRIRGGILKDSKINNELEVVKLIHLNTYSSSMFIIATIGYVQVVSSTGTFPCPGSYSWSWWFLRGVEGFSIILTGLVGNLTHFLISSDTDGIGLCSKMVIVIVIETKIERFKVSRILHVILHTSLWRCEGLATNNLINSDFPSSRKCWPWNSVIHMYKSFVLIEHLQM